jgi:hypothetical protein
VRGVARKRAPRVQDAEAKAAMSSHLTEGLFTLPPQSEQSKAAAAARALKKGSYAAPPGSGPAGETCKSCKHIYRHQMANIYLKCALTRAHWTGGPGTDIRAGAPACSKWEKGE